MNGLEPRIPGEQTTLETRHDAHEQVDKQKRYKQILECLAEYGALGLTAKECAEVMRRKGYIPTNERNYVAPRMTELTEQGKVEPIGKKICQWTGKKVAVYAIRRTNAEGKT